MKRITITVILIWALATQIGCGEGGGSTNNYLIGARLGEQVFMQPGPPSYTFAPWPGAGPAIRVDNVVQFSSTVHPSNTGIYEPTTQVAYGQILGPTAGVQVVVYSYTNEYYIQPLTATTINIGNNATWIAPAHPGTITALLVTIGYTLPDTTTTLPPVDGLNVLAMAQQP